MGIGQSGRRSGPGRALLGLLALTLVPWPAIAGEAPPGRTPIKTALERVGAREAVSAKPAQALRRADRQSQSAAPATESPAFFKTRTGVLVLGVLAAGAGYAIYSTQHDRIKSAGKE